MQAEKTLRSWRDGLYDNVYGFEKPHFDKNTVSYSDDSDQITQNFRFKPVVHEVLEDREGRGCGSNFDNCHDVANTWAYIVETVFLVDNGDFDLFYKVDAGI